MKKKKVLIFGFLILVIISTSSYFWSDSSNSNTNLTVKVNRGDFVSEVTTSGEAQSNSLKKINGPENLRKFKIRDIKLKY